MLRVELGYCVPLGIPHSVFKGWSLDDQDKALAFNGWKNHVCSKCGTAPEDWLDDDGTAMEPPPYKVVAQECLGCATLEERRELVPKDKFHSTNTYLQRWTRREAEEWLRRQSLSD